MVPGEALVEIHAYCSTKHSLINIRTNVEAGRAQLGRGIVDVVLTRRLQAPEVEPPALVARVSMRCAIVPLLRRAVSHYLSTGSLAHLQIGARMVTVARVVPPYRVRNNRDLFAHRQVAELIHNNVPCYRGEPSDGHSLKPGHRMVRIGRLRDTGRV